MQYHNKSLPVRYFLSLHPGQGGIREALANPNNRTFMRPFVIDACLPITVMWRIHSHIRTRENTGLRRARFMDGPVTNFYEPTHHANYNRIASSGQAPY